MSVVQVGIASTAVCQRKFYNLRKYKVTKKTVWRMQLKSKIFVDMGDTRRTISYIQIVHCSIMGIV